MIIEDNFFNNPDAVVSYALSQAYFKSTGAFPGLRTNNLAHSSNHFYYQLVVSKVLSIVRDVDTSVVDMYFQRISNQSFDGNHSEIENSGWVHTDNACMSGIVYLNKDHTQYGGTSIYDPIQLDSQPDIPVNELKIAHYKENNVKDIKEYRDKKREFSALFVKNKTIENVYNRLILFDSSIWHSADQFTLGGNADRLTLVFFIR
jgi:hypothetical protein